ncbi:TPR end-of-group domain-containing protein [Pollutibacter soli]|uniref:TPR end-of-group domain-containing protein n=1 Tax=Pollutibacter soli TaxID=3034157 RepID=UPI003013CDF8
MATRQLAVIMFTDIVGYTALMGNDENKAFKLLDINRKLQKPLIEKFNGRWIKELGDGVLASFHSVTDAVSAATMIQEQSRTGNQFQLRIGIHMGEVVFDNDDVFGDGVNIASRIQSAATAGATYLSETVYQNISNKKEFQTEFVKEEMLKNVKDPVKIYQLVADKPAKTTLIASNLDDQKSIAVLPFVNMSVDPEQEYFCDGVTEEIINTLAQLNKLRVVARTSVFAFKGKQLDVREIGHMLNVATLLEGSVRKSGNRLRITTQLVRAKDGAHLWSDKYDRELNDVFAIQEDIAENVGKALLNYLSSQEKDALRRPETNIEAYEHFLKGRQLLHGLQFSESKVHFEKAVASDPGYAPAYAGLASLHAWMYEWEGGRNEDLIAAELNSQKALTFAPNLSESHSARGFVFSLAGRYEEATKAFQKAIELNPKNFDAYYFFGRTSFAKGDIAISADMFLRASEVRREDFQSMLLYAQSLNKLGDKRHSEAVAEGIERARKFLELSPNDKRALSLTCINLLEIGNREEAIAWANKALELDPDDTGVLVNTACMFARDGNKERSLELLEKVFGKGFGKRDWIENDPDYDSLRDEPRFRALLKKLK